MKRILAVLICALATFSVAGAQRLPEVARPENYKLTFTPNLETATFEGDETISIRVLKPTAQITLNAVDLDFHEVTVTSGGKTQKASGTCDKEKEITILTLEKPLAPGAATIHITYAGVLTTRCAASTWGKTIRDASTPPRSSRLQMHAARSRHSTSPPTRPLSISPPLPTRGRLRFRIKKLSPIRPALATGIRSALPPPPRCRHTWRRWSWATSSTSKARRMAFRSASTALLGKRRWGSLPWKQPSTSSAITINISASSTPTENSI